jgi:hypothetical protein
VATVQASNKDFSEVFCGQSEWLMMCILSASGSASNSSGLGAWLPSAGSMHIHDPHFWLAAGQSQSAGPLLPNLSPPRPTHPNQHAIQNRRIARSPIRSAIAIASTRSDGRIREMSTEAGQGGLCSVANFCVSSRIQKT